MEDTITQQLDDKDIECANLLRKTGVGMCAAKVVVALISGSKTQKELAICTNDCQCAISIAVKKLVNANLINVSKVGQVGNKGRPTQEYTLISWDSIVDTIEKATIQKHEIEITQIDRLKELAH